MLATIRYYYSRFGIPGVWSATKLKLGGSDHLIEVRKRGVKAPFFLRLRTSDLPTFEQIFVRQEYDFLAGSPPKVIVDAGANIGLASTCFANRFPLAKIIAIEPEDSNFRLLERNVSPYPNVVPVQAALWNSNGEISLVDPGYGKWGYMTSDDEAAQRSVNQVCHPVAAMTVDRVMRDFGLDRIDILKMDIEGAEREVFAGSSSWIESVESIIVELHERLKPGCNRSFYNGTNGFDSEWRQGERIYLSRRGVIRPGPGAGRTRRAAVA
ncbi:MAG: FkbM family methyltransferase [Chromatiales bacterium]|nr:FkbM family methyltransferase [Chromatiales bacterium]